MTNTIKLKPTDIYEDDKLKAIEFHDLDGNFQFQAMYDPTDGYEPKAIAAFRVWAARMATRLNYELVDQEEL